MSTTFPVWDISYLIALLFFWGSLFFVLDGLFVWLPLENPSTEFVGESTTAAGTVAFIGGICFEVGAILLVIEAVNANQTGCFGWALEKLVSDREGESGFMANSPKIWLGTCHHHHSNRRHLF